MSEVEAKSYEQSVSQSVGELGRPKAATFVVAVVRRRLGWPEKQMIEPLAAALNGSAPAGGSLAP